MSGGVATRLRQGSVCPPVVDWLMGRKKGERECIGEKEREREIGMERKMEKGIERERERDEGGGEGLTSPAVGTTPAAGGRKGALGKKRHVSVEFSC